MIANETGEGVSFGCRFTSTPVSCRLLDRQVLRRRPSFFGKADLVERSDQIQWG